MHVSGQPFPDVITDVFQRVICPCRDANVRIADAVRQFRARRVQTAYDGESARLSGGFEEDKVFGVIVDAQRFADGWYVQVCVLDDSC